MQANSARDESLFADALALPASERGAFLAHACGANVDQLSQLVALVAAHENPDSRISAFCKPALVTPGEQAGHVIGRYKLLQKIGEGGCGAVWMAQQEEPVRRRVALKVIKLGMDTKAVVARFEAERQALALMDHPNIAKVLDGGAAETGRPYFVMELVRGVPITTYCDENALTPTARLELFIKVCQAIQHAHQKGIIHRDIKPSNVLITVVDGEPMPKVIDFGIAKATLGRLTDATLFTAFEQFIGTPAYMSPEQAELSSVDVDTRSDIYSLGVLLYELLTSKPPFDPQTLLQLGLDELRRTIREVEPAKPSTRLSTLDHVARSTVARQRGTGSAQLSMMLRGDLDWIVMRCLEKNRTRRYDTANGIALDIQRHLRNEPVTARPPSTAYLAQKLIRRHRMAFAASAIILLVLIGGAVLSMRQAVRATRAERLASVRLEAAVIAQREAETQHAIAERERARSETEAAISAAVSDFLQKDLLANAVLSHEPARDVSLKTVLDRAASKVERGFPGHPLVEAAIRSTLGTSYHSLGDYAKMMQHLESAFNVRQAELGPEHLQTLIVAGDLVDAYRHMRRYDEAEKLGVETVARLRRTAGTENSYTLVAMGHLAMTLNGLNKPEEAAALYRQVVDIKTRTLGPEHPTTLTMLDHLANIYTVQNKLPEAAALNARVLEAKKRLYGPDHPATLTAISHLAHLYDHQGKLTEAAELRARTLESEIRVLGPEHGDTLAAMNRVALDYARDGKWAEAATLHLRVLEARRRLVGPSDPGTIESMKNLATVYDRQGKLHEASELRLEVWTACENSLGREHPTTITAMHNLALAYTNEGRLKEAEAHYIDAVEMSLRVRATDDPNTLMTITNLGEVQLRGGKFHDAEATLRIALAARTRAMPDSWLTATTRSSLGQTLASLRRFEEAESALTQAFERLETLASTIPPRSKGFTRVTGLRLVRLYNAWGRPEKAAEWQRRTDALAPMAAPPAAVTAATAAGGH
jgi:eukaryotic-like serine/threonine-protein kinase